MKDYKKGAISVRVSTDMQTKYSPDSQIKMCLDYAKQHDIYVSEEHIYRDDGISGQHADKRTAFLKMINDAKSNPKPFDCILVYDFSRFARNKEESVMYKAMLRKKYNIDVISITQPLAEGKERVILESMYEAMDEYYVLNLSENVKRGKKEKASRGEYQGGTPFGYFYDKNTQNLIPNNETKEYVKFIFEEWIKPETSICNLAKTLNNMGIKTVRGYNWCTGSIWYIINNPLYIGYTRYLEGGIGKDFNNENVQITKGKHEPLISNELWEKAQLKVEEHNKKWFKSKRPHLKQDYWLRGLVKCSNCGKNLIRIQRKSGTKTKPFFQCNGYNKKMCDKSHSILQERLEDAILNELKVIFKEKLDISMKPSQQSTNQATLIKNSINRCKMRFERIELAYMDGIDTLEEYKIKKTNIQSELDRLNKELEQIETIEYENIKKEKIYSLCEYAHNILNDDEVDSKIKEQLANELFEKIVYNKDEDTIYITFREQ